MRGWRALLEETVVAGIALALIATLVPVIYRYSTGDSPWPILVFCEAIAFGWGLVLVVVTSPSWRR